MVNELTARDTDDNGTDDHRLDYDAVGNLTDDDQNYEYVYDPFGRLIEVNDTSDQSLIAEYKYNGLGHRVGVHYDYDADGTVEDTSDDPWFYFAYDDRWRIVAMYEDTDSDPTEQFVYHAPGISARGGYIDDVILRDRDTDGNGSLDERIYYCQNWRHDVSALVTDTGTMLEWVKYTSYGIPMGLPKADTDSDFDLDQTDVDNIANPTAYDVRYDVDLDGDVDSSDETLADNDKGDTLGWEALSLIDNRKGYAGYEQDHAVAVNYHVRHRVLSSELGRWTRLIVIDQSGNGLQHALLDARAHGGFLKMSSS